MKTYLAAFLFAGTTFALVPPARASDESAPVPSAEATPTAATTPLTERHFAVAANLGVGTGQDHAFGSVGVDGTYSNGLFRTGVLAESASTLLSGSFTTLGGFVGFGTISDDATTDVQVGLESGAHLYRKLGAQPQNVIVSGGSADLFYMGFRGALTFRFGKDHTTGLGLLVYVRNDVARTSVHAREAIDGPHYVDAQVDAGQLTFGASLRFMVAF